VQMRSLVCLYVAGLSPVEVAPTDMLTAIPGDWLSMQCIGSQLTVLMK
jgi:hypothetical protein